MYGDVRVRGHVRFDAFAHPRPVAAHVFHDTARVEFRIAGDDGVADIARILRQFGIPPARQWFASEPREKVGRTGIRVRGRRRI